MMQRRNSSSSSSSVPTHHFNPSLIRFPPPFTGNRVGAPPSPLPPISPYSQIPATLPPRHSRSISQPSSFHSLPMSVEERNDVGFSPSMQPPSPFTMYHSTSRMVAPAGENLPPPPRKSHRRTNSVDVTHGFSSMMPQTLMSPPSMSLERSISLEEVSDWSTLAKEESIFGGRTSESDDDDVLRAYLNLDNMDLLSKTVEEEMESSSRGMRKTNYGGNSSESEGESSASGNNMKGLKRRAGEDISPRHYRSVSMDSCFFGNLNQLPPSSAAQVSPTNSGEGSSNAFGFRVGNIEFSAAEMMKISADEKLSAMVMVDPKRAKRIVSNRLSAARSKEREAQYIAQLEHKVHTLQSETTTLSAQLTYLQRDSMVMHNQNSELKFRLQAREQQAQLRNALSEQLTEEVQRLRLMIGDPSRSESYISKTTLTPEIFQQQLTISQLQQQHSNQNSTMKANHAIDEWGNQLV